MRWLFAAALCCRLALADTGPAYDAELRDYAYPFPVQKLGVHSQRQDLSLAYMDVQPAGRETVLLLHGKNFSGAYWEPTVRLLSQRGYRVVVPDQIGFGKSSKPLHYQYSFQEMGRQTESLLGSLRVRGPVHVVGHSMGGMLAARFALMYPARVRSLSLVNPIGLEDWKRSVPYRSVDQNFASELQSSPETLRAYMRENYFGGQWKPGYEKLLEMPAGWMRGPDREQVAWTAALTSDMVFTQPVVYEFGQIKAPTLLLIGQKDRTAIGKAWAPPAARAALGNYPALGRRAAAAIPRAELVELPASGHLPQVEQFEVYAKALTTFFQRHSLK
jgi:pimeloyl-ACP methyl ester carboxylesterase